MADELNTMLTDGALADEEAKQVTANVQDAAVVDTAGSVDNPGGSTPTGGATDNTPIEQAPDSQPPAAAVTQNVAEPTTDVGGGGGGGVAGSTTTENPEQPTVVQTGVAQSDPELGTATPLAPGEEANNPPTVAVLPGTPEAPPEAGQPALAMMTISSTTNCGPIRASPCCPLVRWLSWAWKTAYTAPWRPHAARSLSTIPMASRTSPR